MLRVATLRAVSARKRGPAHHARLSQPSGRACPTPRPHAPCLRPMQTACLYAENGVDVTHRILLHSVSAPRNEPQQIDNGIDTHTGVRCAACCTTTSKGRGKHHKPVLAGSTGTLVRWSLVPASSESQLRISARASCILGHGGYESPENVQPELKQVSLRAGYRCTH